MATFPQAAKETLEPVRTRRRPESSPPMISPISWMPSSYCCSRKATG